MKPGRELDALVAEKVMGWKFAGAFTTDPELGCDRWATDPSGCERYYQDVPRYSTDIAAAWEVVGAIQKSGHPWPFAGLFHEHADLDELPSQICLAALKAVGATPASEP